MIPALALGEIDHHWNLEESRWSKKTIKSEGGIVGSSKQAPEFFDGAPTFGDSVFIDAPSITDANLPSAAFAVEARVRLNETQRWGKIVGYAQDNGSYERGWLLGYENSRFVFWISTGGGRIIAAADRDLELNEWTRVRGEYDGENLRLYMDDELVGKAEAEGDVAYPEQAKFTIGAYRDDNEFYAMHGQISEVRIGELAGPPEPLRFLVRPAAQFLDATSARIFWEAEEDAVVEFGETDELGQTARGKSEVILTDLKPQTLYFYRITVGDLRTPIYELNNALNFHHGGKGFTVMMGADVARILELLKESEHMIVAFDDDAKRVSKARSELYAAKVYGSRATVSQVEELQQLPVTACFADRVIAKNWTPEIERILIPGRGVALIEGEQKARPAAAGAADWTHQYGDAGNTAANGEALSGARATTDLAVQWVGRPGADFGIDRQSRMPAPLAANGRLFHQGMNRLAAINAANGAILWTIEIPDLRRLNMPRDASNWCADDDRLFLAVKERAWVFDAETGVRETTLMVPGDHADHDWGYIARVGERLIGSATKPDSNYKRYWAKQMWFDGKGGSLGTAKVCSDALFGYEVGTNELAWNYERGAIINSTIGAADGRIYFVESRDPSLDAHENGQISAPELWNDQFLVALDAQSGKQLWERALDVENGDITFYLQATPDSILITASNTAYHLYTFDAKTGEPNWNRTTPWPDNHHSGHIQHPVIVGGVIYLQPNGYDLKTGEFVTTKMGARSGCHTYIGARDALIYRGAGRRVAMWDREKETVTAWNRLRPSCWLSMIPANGMLLVPEGGGGCSCGNWMETSLGFAPLRLLRGEGSE